MDSEKSVSLLLENCKPSKSVEAKSRQQKIVRRPGADEPSRISQHNIELAGLVIPRAQKGAQFQGELYYPLTEEVQDRAGVFCKRMIFHLCISITGAKFLLPQKLPADNLWNKSMELVVEAGRKGAITISSNKELQQYDVEESSVVIPEAATAEDLEVLCNQAFADLIIDRIDHPVLREAMGLSDIWGGF